MDCNEKADYLPRHVGKLNLKLFLMHPGKILLVFLSTIFIFIFYSEILVCFQEILKKCIVRSRPLQRVIWRFKSYSDIPVKNTVTYGTTSTLRSVPCLMSCIETHYVVSRIISNDFYVDVSGCENL